MNTYTITTMGGRLLVRTPDHEAAYRMAHRIADEGGCYVELHTPSGYVDYVYPSRVLA